MVEHRKTQGLKPPNKGGCVSDRVWTPWIVTCPQYHDAQLSGDQLQFGPARAFGVETATMGAFHV